MEWWNLRPQDWCERGAINELWTGRFRVDGALIKHVLMLFRLLANSAVTGSSKTTMICPVG
jgi:hypothetical protein